MRHHEFALQELRPLMQRHELSDEERARVWWLIKRSAKQDMGATCSRVTPYLRGFPKHYAGVLCRIERTEDLALANEALLARASNSTSHPPASRALAPRSA